MRYPLLFLILFLQSSVLLGQETKLVSRSAEKGGQEEYYVLKDNKQIKHGPYVRYIPPFGTRGYCIIESGNYKDAEKDGIWKYYYSNGLQRITWNSLKETGAYVNDKKNGVWTSFYLDSIASTTIEQDIVDIKKSNLFYLDIDQKAAKVKQVGMYLNDKKTGEWFTFDRNNNLAQRYNFTKERLIYESSIADTLEYNQNRKALFLGGLNCLKEFLRYNYRFQDVLLTKDSTFVTISFLLNTNGSTQDHRIIRTSRSKELEKEMLRLITSTDFNWIPALKDGQKVDCEYKIGLDIIMLNDDVQNRRFYSFFTILDQ